MSLRVGQRHHAEYRHSALAALLSVPSGELGSAFVSAGAATSTCLLAERHRSLQTGLDWEDDQTSKFRSVN
jgi:hypothetical protein